MTHSEGDIFAVPLEQGGFGVGVIARMGRNMILAYFLDIQLDSHDAWRSSARPRKEMAVWIAFVGDLKLSDGRWPLLGRVQPWKRSDWPVPEFARREEFTGRSYRVIYGDGIDSRPVEILADLQEILGLPEDGPAGAGFVEERLSQLLIAPSRNPQWDR